MEKSFAELDAVEIVRLVRSGDASAREVTEASLARIGELDAAISAFVTLTAASALAGADALDRQIAVGEDPGPLAGVPVGIKDLLFTAGTRTTFGSEFYADYIPSEDDIAVARLRKAGAVVVGKTNTSEFGYAPLPRNRLFPATRNPWNRELSPAGSSAGSAAAVAAAMVPLALGSDGGGSIRVPAALTGIVGFKPSFGRVPVYPGCRDHTKPGVSSWESLEHIGPLTRTVADARLAYNVLRGPDPRDRHSLPAENPPEQRQKDLRIAFSVDMDFATVDREVASICAAAADRFGEAMGVAVEYASPPVGDVQTVFEAIVAMETDMAGLRAMQKGSTSEFGDELKRVLARRWSADDFASAITARKRVANDMARFMSEWDFLLTPVTASAAFPIDRDFPEMINDHPVPPSAFAPFAAIANLTGLPAISVPAGLTGDGRPAGLQIIGRHLADNAVLNTAEAFETARPFPRLLDNSALLRQSLRP